MHVQFYSNIVIDTTGLQPATTTVMEVNGSITVTCVFASGASSTGCQVTIFIKDSLQEVLSRKIIRPHGSSVVSLVFPFSLIHVFFRNSLLFLISFVQGSRHTKKKEKLL